MSAGTVLSPDGLYRYRLERTLAGDLLADRAPVVFIMLNPSTADATTDDPTLRRCIGYAKAWGAAELVVVNLYAWRTPDPAALEERRIQGVDIVGPLNDVHLAEVAATPGALHIAGWGAHTPGSRPARAEHADRIRTVFTIFADHRAQLHALATTATGQPRHPLYLSATLRTAPWSPPNADRTPAVGPRFRP